MARQRPFWPIADNPVFLFAAWQLPFFVALIIGYHRRWLGEHILARVPASPLRDGYVLPLGAAVGFLAYLSATNAAIFAPYILGGNTAALLDAWFLKSHLPCRACSPRSSSSRSPGHS
ncbi:MAG: hypothetical protein U0841_26570 [Chloroflexia bacterium]